VAQVAVVLVLLCLVQMVPTALKISVEVEVAAPAQLVKEVLAEKGL
jgi:hypothetical protein